MAAFPHPPCRWVLESNLAPRTVVVVGRRLLWNARRVLVVVAGFNTRIEHRRAFPSEEPRLPPLEDEEERKGEAQLNLHTDSAHRP